MLPQYQFEQRTCSLLSDQNANCSVRVEIKRETIIEEHTKAHFIINRKHLLFPKIVAYIYTKSAYVTRKRLLTTDLPSDNCSTAQKV